jgi:hypothetical protein
LKRLLKRSSRLLLASLVRFVSFFVVFCFFASCSNESSKPHLKQILVFRSTISSGKEANRHLLEKKIFKESGLLLSDIHYNNEYGVDYQSNYKYDKKGREIEDIYILHGKVNAITKTSYDERDSVSAYAIFKPNKKRDFTIYPLQDKTGLNDKDLCINADGSTKFWDEYSYDQQGNRTRWIRYNSDSIIQLTVVYEYDKQNREIKNSGSGEFGGTYYSKYNNRGSKAQEIAYNTVDSIFLWLQVFHYDQSNKITKILEYASLSDYPENPSRVFHYEYIWW